MLFCVFQVYSEYENVTYSLTGVGADKYPFNVFVSDPHTGDIRLTQVLDREFIPYYYVSDSLLLYLVIAFIRFNTFSFMC